MEKTEKIKNVSYAVLIWVGIIGSLIFVLNYGFTDWEKVSNEFSESTIDLLEGVHCEIDYNGFHYKGLCTDRDEILQFVKDINTYGNYTKEKDRRHYCKVGAYWLWSKQHPDADVIDFGNGIRAEFKDIDSWCGGI